MTSKEKQSIDLNCDLGEYENLTEGISDAAIMPYISSCNIACGGHAGNQLVIEQTIKSAIEHKVNIGAHPSFPDRANFGRKKMHLPVSELKSMLRDQVELIKASAQTQGTVLSHVKPHGALYNQAAVDLGLATILAEIIAEQDSDLMFYGLAHSAMAQAAKLAGVPFIAEGFVDRAYTTARTLQARGEAGAVIEGVDEILKRVLDLLKNGQVISVSGEAIEVNVATLCLHGDHKGAARTAKTLHQGLIAAGFAIKPPQSKLNQWLKNA